MNLLNKLNQTLGMTQTESRVVLFLIIAFLVGMGIKIIKDSHKPVPSFDYAALDSEFAARSSLLNGEDSLETNAGADENARYQAASSDSAEGQLTQAGLDINRASKEEFIKLPGIGSSIAQRIVKYRELNGHFTSPEDLMKVKGIGRKRFEKIAPYCTAGK